MKSVLFIMFLIMLSNTTIQAQENTFMRFYNRKGKMITKGLYNSDTDSSLIILKNNKKVDVPINKIGVIKMGRGAGPASTIGAAIGGVTLGILFAANSETDGEALSGPGVGFVGGLLAGGTAGALLGGVAGMFTKNVSFKINGNSATWQEQKKLIAELPSSTSVDK